MRGKYILIVVVLLTLAFGVGRLSAAPGTLDSLAPPDDPLSASYTLEDIYNWLNDGTEGTPSTFTEPATGPTVGTMHTLNEIMGVAPAADNTDGAVPAEVLTGKTYWSLRTDGTWGPQTGTAAVGNNVNGPDGAKTFSIPDGFYSGKTATANDVDLVSGNVRSGVNIFGVAGDPNVVDTSSGDAAAVDILSGKKAWVDGSEVTGSMPNNGAVRETHEMIGGPYNNTSDPPATVPGAGAASPPAAVKSELEKDISKTFLPPRP